MILQIKMEIEMDIPVLIAVKQHILEVTQVKEIRFIDLFSGIGGFRWGLERANQMVGTGVSQGRYSSNFEEGEPRKQPNNNSGFKGANYSAYEQIANGNTSSRGTGFEEKRESQLPASLAELEKASPKYSTQRTEWKNNNGDKTGQGEQCGSRNPWGFTSNYFRCVWSNDFNKYANQVYIKQFGKENHYSGDIREIDAADIPAHDLLCGGFPCQSFSVAGKRKGFTDTRGTLFFEILRIAKHHRPELLLLENVKGLLSAPLVDEAGNTIPGTHGKVFETILKSLEELGYWWEYQVLNSKNHGVPQNRERVFIIGHLREGCTTPIFPITETDDLANQNGSGGSTVQAEVGSAIHSRYGAGWRTHGQEQLISTAIDGNYYKGIDRHGQRTMILDTYNRGVKEEEAYSLKTNPSITSSAIVALLTPLRQVRTDRGKEARRESQKKGKDDTPYGDKFRHFVPSKEPVTGTVTTGINNDALIGHNTRIRRLTPVECERLQAFPDGWTEFGYLKGSVIDKQPVYGWKEVTIETDDGEETETRWVKIGEREIDPIRDSIRISDTQRYKMLGNAVTTNVITFLGHKIRESINSKSFRKDGLGR